MVRLISRQRGGLAALKLTKLFEIDDFLAAKDSGKLLIIIMYCYLIIIPVQADVSFRKSGRKFVQDIETYQFTHLSAVIAAHRHVEHRGVACFDPWLIVIE